MKIINEDKLHETNWNTRQKRKEAVNNLLKNKPQSQNNGVSQDRSSNINKLKSFDKSKEREEEKRLDNLISASEEKVKKDAESEKITDILKKHDSTFKLDDFLNKWKGKKPKSVADWVKFGTGRLEIITGNGEEIVNLLGANNFANWLRDGFKPEEATDPNNAFNKMLSNIPENWWKDKDHLNDVKKFTNLYNVYARASKREDGDTTLKKLSSEKNLDTILKRGNLFNQNKASIDYIVKEFVNSELPDNYKQKIFFDNNGNFRDRSVIELVLKRIDANNNKK